MLTPEERELMEEYEPLREAELTRLGISPGDQDWLFAGWGEPSPGPNRAGYEADLARLRALPTGMGVEGFCSQVLGLDYWATRREIFGDDRGA